MTHAWLDVMRNAGIARIVHMSYRSKTYTWNDVILVKRSMIRVFLYELLHNNYMLHVIQCLNMKAGMNCMWQSTVT